MSKGISKQQKMDLVFQAIPTKDDDRWASGADLMEMTGLGERQVREGVEGLRDTYPEFPLVSSPKGYQFTIDPEVVERFQRARAQTAHTALRRLYSGAIKPFIEKVAPAQHARFIGLQFKQVMEQVATLIR